MAQAKIGYAAMLEQFGPQEVVGYSAAAEAAGFSGVMAADHFQPWVPQQGQAAFVWNVLSALGERTTGDLGPGVTCPSFRMHPAVVAQASATLAAMYPGRHWLGLGSGEALNEHVLAGYWPVTPERIGYPQPLDFEQMAKLVRPEDFAGRMVISSDPERHRAEIQKFLDMGFHQVYLHNVGRNHAEWIDVFGQDVLPKLHA